MSVSLPPELNDLRDLFELHRSQIERELGAPFMFDANGPARWRIALDAERARVVLDRRCEELVNEAPDRESLMDTLSLLWSLHRMEDGAVEVRDCGSVGDAADLIESAVEETWPSFGLHRVDWTETCARWRPRVLAAREPIPEMRAWLAELRDRHTWVRPGAPFGRLPYEADVVGADVVLREVPEDTVGWEVGARPGMRLLDVDGAELWRQAAATPRSRSSVAGRDALQGPVGEFVTLRLDSGITWREPYAIAPWREVVSWRVLPSGAGYLRLRLFHPNHEAALNAALDELRGRDLVIDLRGNGGGNGLMAARLRARFLREAGVIGHIRYRDPCGDELTPLEPIFAEPVGGPFSGRVTFLVDALTYSASEDCLLGLAGESHVRVLGTPTGGGSGRMRSLRLLPGWRLTITTCHTFTKAGHCIEGSGFLVDGPLPAEFA